MKKTKIRFLSFFAVLALSLGIAGCGGGANDSSSPIDSNPIDSSAPIDSSSSTSGNTSVEEPETSSSVVEEPEEDTKAPTISLYCAREQLVPLGSKFVIPVDQITVKDNKDTAVTPTYSVTFDGEEVKLSKNAFVAENEGMYVLTVKAEDTSGNRSEQIVTIHTTAKGEINSFDDDLRMKTVKTKGVSTVSLNTDPAYIKDGTGSAKLTIQQHVSLGWPGLIVEQPAISNILDYHSFSFWAYNDGTEPVEIMLQRNEISDKARFVLEAKMWTKVEVTARNYDKVFTVMEGNSWGEPECGMCEDIKCVTFHFVNPANTPEFNIYIDSIQANETAVLDTLDMTADVEHPVVGVPYEMPDVIVKYNGGAVDADVSYKVFDASFNEVSVGSDAVTLEKAGKYIVQVEAKYGNLTSRKNYTVIAASSRADNEIEFFEEEGSLHFITSKHFNVSLSSETAHPANNSKKSLKFTACESTWPYATINNVPHADLDGVAYIYFYARTDYKLSGTQKAYLGLRNGGQGKVVKRMTLSNDWQGFSFTKQQIIDMGFDSLEGIQLSVELYEEGKGQNGWCPVAFNTYIDNFTFVGEQEPTQKAENVVLDFANYRDLDDINSEYTFYEFFNSAYTVNGIGSLKLSCPSGRWPTATLGDKFDAYDLEYVKYLVLDVYVPTIAEGTNVRIGANDKGYQRLYAADAGKWVTIKIPVSALVNGTTTLTTLKGVKLTFGRNDGSVDINLGTLYIGKMSLEYFDVDPADKDHVKPAGVLYDFYDFKEAAKVGGEYVKLDGHRTAKLITPSGAWTKLYLPSEVDTLVGDVSKVSYVYFDMYVAMEELTASEYLRFNYYYWNGTKWEEKFFDRYLPLNQWTTVEIPVGAGTPKLSEMAFLFPKYNQKADGSFEWEAVGKTAGDAIYIREIGYTSNATALRDFDAGFETTANMGMFYVTNQDYRIFRNSNKAYVKEGNYSLGFTAIPRWPQLLFTEAFANWMKANSYVSVSFDMYIADNGNVTAMEGVKGTSSPKLNEWFTITVGVDKISGGLIQINKSSATASYFYLDNFVFTVGSITPEQPEDSSSSSSSEVEIPETSSPESSSPEVEEPEFSETADKEDGMLYTFYDADEAAKIVHPGATGVAADIDGKKVAMLEMKHSEWGKINLPSDVDTLVKEGAAISYVYVDLYVQMEAAAGDYVRYTWNTGSGEKFNDVIIKANEWVTILMPYTGSNLSDFWFYVLKNQGGAWGAIGNKAGEALYINEIGYTSKATVLRDFDEGFESTANMGMFYVTNNDFYMFRNTNEAFVKSGKASMGFVASTKWPIYYFTSAFQTWMAEQGYKSFTFELYIHDPNSKVSGAEGLLSGKASKKNQWTTVTVAEGKVSTKLQINKSAATNVYFYIDNIVFSK